MFIMTGLRGMLEGMDYYLLNKGFEFVARLIDRSAECEKMALMTSMHTWYRYSEIVADVTGDIRERA